MRPFFWRIVICLTPVVLAALVTWNAWANDRFKLGVDLSGGTILVYEIDTRKQQERDKEAGSAQSDPMRDTNLLAESLKRRIDPTATYNIVIRPAGGAGRVEIVLPTGGQHRAEKAQKAWDALLLRMEKLWNVKNLEIGRGKLQELVERIQSQVAERTWANRLFNTKEAWDDLIKKAVVGDEAKWVQLEPLANKPASPPVLAATTVGLMSRPLGVGPSLATSAALARAQRTGELRKIERGDLQGFIDTISDRLEGTLQEKSVASWVKEQAWNTLLAKAADKFLRAPEDKKLDNEEQQKIIKARAEQLKDIPPDNFEELTGRLMARGNIFSQAALETLRPLLGSQPITDGVNDRKKVEEFITENYGPSPKVIEESIISESDGDIGRTKDLTVEEVQRIKDLVAKVGSLEFKILANDKDDIKGEDEARDYINSIENKDELRRLQERGEPPPGPRQGARGELKQFPIELARGLKSVVTYGWVELGPQERRDLGLDNASRNTSDTRKKRIWDYVQSHLGEAIRIPEPTSSDKRLLLQGALFYSRKCMDRNMPEEERRRKQYEYFILARNPEIDPATGKETPKIDGSYLTQATSQISDGRPAVHFVFNEAGGDLFRKLTHKNIPSGSGSEESQIKRHLAIILDGLMMSAPTINSEIGRYGQISGSFTKREVDNLVNILRSGALPATLKPQPVSESTIGATLGQDTISSGLHAIALAFGAVVIFMVIYYRFAGVVACLALLANLVLTVGFMVFVQATFTLPGLAGLVLMLGMAVDANVLIYERLREERERGASLALAIRNGYDRAFPTIIDTHLSSIFTAIVLYIVGNDQLKGFGVSLTVGLIISLFSSLYMTRLMFDFWLSRHWLHKLSMGKLFSRPNFDFMSIRYFWFTLTVVLTILGGILFIGRLPNDLDIDFVGGTAYGGQLVPGEAKTMKEMRDLISEDRQKELLHVLSVEQRDSEGREFKIIYEDPDSKQTEARTVLLANKAEGNSPEDRLKKMKERASILPDSSVEQLFPSFAKEPDTDKSRYFTIRTSEREPELVQASIDRLLREKGKDGTWHTLLKKIWIYVNEAPLLATGKEAKADKRGEDGQLLSRSKDVKLYFTKVPLSAQEKELIRNGTLPSAKEKEELDAKAEPASPSFIKAVLTREVLKAFHVTDIKELPFQMELTGEGKTEEGRFARIKLTFTPDLTTEQAEKVKAALDNTVREFESRPQPERLENFDSELAGETRLRAMWAILASWVSIALYLWFRFGNWTFGLAAVLCLIHDLFFTLGIIAVCHYLHGMFIGSWLGLQDFKLDLTAVAALLTLVGYSVNDTIVVFDRIREVRGKNPDLTPAMINDSVNQTLSRTILTSLTTWLVVFVLYVIGGPGVHLFAFVMVVGVVIGTYSSIYVASPLLLMFGEGSRSRSQGSRQVAPVSAPA